MEQNTETNKTEEATPFKLKRAREKGTVARGMDLGFLSMLSGLTVFALVAGSDMAQKLSEAMRQVLATVPGAARDPQQALALTAMAYGPALQAVALLGATVVLVVALFEIIQVRGLVFTMHPLKPDFNRLNPAKNLKRLFSARMLKDTLKNILKMAAYSGAAYLVVQYTFDSHAQSIVDAASLLEAMRSGGFRLLFVFVVLALIFAALDQVLVRQEFQKQMRMSRSELTREHKEREGEPRLKQKRKQMHAEFAKQARSLGNLRGSDMLIVNPQHYAVGLGYDTKTMSAPKVTAKGRNHFALLLKRRAARLSLPTFEHPELARSLYRSCDKGDEVSASDYRAVADLYLKLARLEQQRRPDADV